MKAAILPIQGGGRSFFQCYVSSAAPPEAQQASKGHWGQREEVGFPEELGSLALLI
jgi:hypothetical protein